MASDGETVQMTALVRDKTNERSTVTVKPRK